jgi:hypothetical protein
VRAAADRAGVADGNGGWFLALLADLGFDSRQLRLACAALPRRRGTRVRSHASLARGGRDMASPDGVRRAHLAGD